MVRRLTQYSRPFGRFISGGHPNDEIAHYPHCDRPGRLRRSSRPVVAQKGGTGSAQLQLVEATIGNLQKAMQTKLITFEQLVADVSRAHRGVRRCRSGRQRVHPRERRTRSRRRASSTPCRHPGIARSPLYGIPVLLKDNIDTATCRRRPAAWRSRARSRRRCLHHEEAARAGAIILGKATLTEFANFIAIGMPTGYSSLGLFGFNPYDPRVDPRPVAPFSDGRPVLQTGGSSSGSGIGVNANLVTVAIGTETSGSILSPASANGVVGIKPTVGLVSRDGIIPITADQDTAGPIARTVTDAAILLGVIAGFDPATGHGWPCLTPGNCFSDYTRFLDKKALKGARIAVARPIPANRARHHGCRDRRPARAGRVRRDLPEPFPAQLGICVANRTSPAARHCCSTVLMYGQKRDLNAYLADARRPGPHARRDHRVQQHVRSRRMKYGQAIFEAAQHARHLARQRGHDALPADLAEDRARSRGASTPSSTARTASRAPRTTSTRSSLGQQLRRRAGQGGLSEHHRAWRLRRLLDTRRPTIRRLRTRSLRA